MLRKVTVTIGRLLVTLMPVVMAWADKLPVNKGDLKEYWNSLKMGRPPSRAQEEAYANDRYNKTYTKAYDSALSEGLSPEDAAASAEREGKTTFYRAQSFTANQVNDNVQVQRRHTEAVQALAGAGLMSSAMATGGIFGVDVAAGAAADITDAGVNATNNFLKNTVNPATDYYNRPALVPPSNNDANNDTPTLLTSQKSNTRLSSTPSAPSSSYDYYQQMMQSQQSKPASPSQLLQSQNGAPTALPITPATPPQVNTVPQQNNIPQPPTMQTQQNPQYQKQQQSNPQYKVPRQNSQSPANPNYQQWREKVE